MIFIIDNNRFYRFVVAALVWYIPWKIFYYECDSHTSTFEITNLSTQKTDMWTAANCCNKTECTATHAFSFSTVYIYLRQNDCLRGYPPGLQFWHHFVCIWLLKLNKLWKITQYDTRGAALRAYFGRDCERTYYSLWTARVPNGLKILSKDVQIIPFCDNVTRAATISRHFRRLFLFSSSRLILYDLM